MATFIPRRGSEIPQTAWRGQKKKKKSPNELMNKPKQLHSHRKHNLLLLKRERGKLGVWD